MIAFALLLAAPQAQELKCPQRADMFSGPVVRDEDAARGIFAAVVGQFAGGEDYSGYQIVIQGTAADRKWIVFHASQRIQRGGGMAMTIDRCTGAISNIQYQR